MPAAICPRACEIDMGWRLRPRRVEEFGELLLDALALAEGLADQNPADAGADQLFHVGARPDAAFGDQFVACFDQFR